MKKLLIVDKSFALGGVQTALINFVKTMKDTYQIDVLMFYDEGPLKDKLPKEVRVLRPSYLVRLHGMSISDARERKGLLTYLLRVGLAACDKVFTNRFSLALAFWFQKPLRGYDVAIAFHHEDRPTAMVSGFYRFVTEKTDAPRKLGWIHYDAAYAPFDDRKNRAYFAGMDRIVCVSKATRDAFAARHPELSVPIDYCYNCLDLERIAALAEEAPPIRRGAEEFLCVSASRLTAEKGLPRGIRALAPVFHTHPELVWYLAGEGPERSAIEQAIREEGLADRIRLLGHQDNPFSLMKHADLVLNLSYHEAAPMVYLEAKAVKTPVFATKTSSTEELLSDGADAFLCENSEAGMARAFADLMDHKERIARAKEHLARTSPGNQEAIAALRRILG